MTSYAWDQLRRLEPSTQLLAGSLLGLALALCSMAVLGNGLLPQFLIIFFFGLMHLALLMRAPGMFAFYFLVFYSGMGMLVANALLSGSVYITEASYTSYDIGALPGLVVSLTAFFCAFAFIVWKFDKPIQPRIITSAWETKIVLGIAALPIAVSYMAFFVYGTPWTSGESRSAFWALRNIAQFFFTFGFNRLGPTVLLAGMIICLARDKKLRKICIAAGILNVVALILFGGRAGAIVAPSLLLSLPTAFALARLEGKNLRWVLYSLAGAACAVIVVTMVSYAAQISTTGENQGAVVGLFTRLVLQGHVWWNIYYTMTVSHIGDTGASFWNEISTFFDWAPSRSGRGSDLVLRLIAPKVLYLDAIRQDIIFAGGWPALGLYYFGPVVLQFVQVLLGVTYAGYGLLLKREILRGQFVSAMILYFLWWQFISEAVLNGELYVLFNIRFVAFFMLYLAIRIFGKYAATLRDRMAAQPENVRTA